MFNPIARLLLGLSFLLPQALMAANDLRDPTRPLSYAQSKTVTESALVLHSVLISDSRKVAVINGQRLQEGEAIKHSEGVHVLRIFPHSVELKQAGKRWRLRLNKSMSVQRENIVKASFVPSHANEPSEN